MYCNYNVKPKKSKMLKSDNIPKKNYGQWMQNDGCRCNVPSPYYTFRQIGDRAVIVSQLNPGWIKLQFCTLTHNHLRLASIWHKFYRQTRPFCFKTLSNTSEYTFFTVFIKIRFVQLVTFAKKRWQKNRLLWQSETLWFLTKSQPEDTF